MTLARCLFAALAIAACAGDDAESSAAATGTGAAPPTSGTGNISTACDNGQPGDYAIDSAVCRACIDCTELGPCAPLWQPCEAGSGRPCDLFTACIGVCLQQCDTNQNGTIQQGEAACFIGCAGDESQPLDRKSTRLNSSHGYISYAVFCLKKKKN